MRIEVSDEQVREAFARVSTHPVFAESAELVRGGGQPLEMIRAMCAIPDVLQGFADWSEAIYPGGSLDRDVQEVVILASSIENACQFCVDSHVDMCRALGLSDDPAGLLESPGDMTAPQRLAVEWTQAVMRDSNQVPSELFNQVQGCFGDAGVVELTLLVGYINMLNMFNNTLENAYRGEMDSTSSGGGSSS